MHTVPSSEFRVDDRRVIEGAMPRAVSFRAKRGIPQGPARGRIIAVRTPRQARQSNETAKRRGALKDSLAPGRASRSQRRSVAENAEGRRGFEQGPSQHFTRDGLVSLWVQGSGSLPSPDPTPTTTLQHRPVESVGFRLQFSAALCVLCASAFCSSSPASTRDPGLSTIQLAEVANRDREARPGARESFRAPLRFAVRSAFAQLRGYRDRSLP